MDTISFRNRDLIAANERRRRDFLLDPVRVYPWWSRCGVRTLLVTDGNLSFGPDDFGLSTFVNILLNDSPSYAQFNLTLAHLRSNATNQEVMSGSPGIVRSIKGFRFDDPAHFAPGMYDEVWLFGIETFFHQADYAQRNADHARYPADRLGDDELRALNAHMNGLGGLFATGDHGSLGKGLCGSVNRARSMRHWQSFGAPDEVSMNGPRRNDTNNPGPDSGTQFSDQSDDIPQYLDLKLYSARASFLRLARYPHPVLCGRTGRIDVLPDHPHEGECRVPADASLIFGPDGTREYPDATDGSGQVLPEVIARSRVRAGNTADKNGSKMATEAHSFGAVSAYDGHRAAVGRVICDATWHHFVNVNLIGVVEGGIFDQFNDPGRVEDVSKHDGFLSSASGRAVLDRIKNYYTNIGIWIAPPARHACINKRLWWRLIYKDRLMEATLLDPATPFHTITSDVFYSIGVHARDVLGRTASQCQTLEWLFDLTRYIWVEVREWIDPWGPVERLRLDRDLPLPVIDPMPLLDVAVGAALVAMRQAFPYPPEKIDDEHDRKAHAAAIDGARHGLALAARQSRVDLDAFAKALEGARHPDKA